METSQERCHTRAREVLYLTGRAAQRQRPIRVLLSETSEAYTRPHAAFLDSFAERGWGWSTHYSPMTYRWRCSASTV
jgi:hypothetical protein